MKRFGKLLFMLFMTCLVVIMLIPTALAPAYADDEFYVVNTGDELETRMAQGGNIKLGADILDAYNEFTVPSGKTVVLDLNGHDIERRHNVDYGEMVIKLESSSSLTLINSDPIDIGEIRGGYEYFYSYYDNGSYYPSRTFNGSGGGVFVGHYATFTMNGCKITGNHARYGGGVFVSPYATFTMNNSTIANCQAQEGGGVYLCRNSNFIMNSGSIVNNSAESAGGVYFEYRSSFSVSGNVKIQDNLNTSNAQNNVLIVDRDTHLQITGELTLDSVIRVIPPEPDYSKSRVTIADVASGVRSPVENIFSDDSDFYATNDYTGAILMIKDGGTGTGKWYLHGYDYKVYKNGDRCDREFYARDGEMIVIIADPGFRITSVRIEPGPKVEVRDAEYLQYDRASIKGLFSIKPFTYTFSDDDTYATIYVSVERFTINHYPETDATCTETGNEEYWTGVTANQTYYYKNERCLDPVDFAAISITPALGHDIVHHVAQAPTCLATGWTAYDTCSRCDYTTYQSLPIIDHIYENGFCTMCGKSVCEVDSWAELQACINTAESGSTIVLRQTIIATENDTVLTIPEGKTLTIDLQDYDIDRGLEDHDPIEGGGVISLGQRSRLTIIGHLDNNIYPYRSAITEGHNIGNGGGIYVGKNAFLSLSKVYISWNQCYSKDSSSISHGAGIYLDQNATLFVDDSIIYANYANGYGNGGGIYACSGATIRVDDSKFDGNNGNMGGAVYVGSGVSFTMSNSTIIDCSGNQGGGVCVNGGTFLMEGGSISQNNGWGFRIEDAGGVFVQSGTFTMEGGSITDNKGRHTAGVYVANGATFNMIGGAITGNIGEVCGGVNNDGTFNVSDSVTINNNGKGDYWDHTDYPPFNVYTDRIDIAGSLSPSSVIGITTKTAVTYTNPQFVFTNGFTDRATTDSFFLDDATGLTIREVGGELAVCKLGTVTLSGSGYTATGIDGEHAADTSFTAVVGDLIALITPRVKKLVLSSLKCGDDDVAATQTDFRRYIFVMPGGDVTVNASAVDFTVTQVSAVAATCTENGNIEYWTGSTGDDTYYYSDNRCREADQISATDVVTLATGHTPAVDAAVAPKCSETGLTQGSHCSVCNVILEEQEEVPALGHDLVYHNGQAATCTEKGWNAYNTCTRCDYTTYVEIAALGHDPVHHDGQAATCTEKGWNAYDTCSRCDYTTYAEISALGHNYNQQNVCTRCGKSRGAITSWADLQNFFDDPGDCVEACLSNDITAGDGETVLTVPENKTIGLDLNGFTIDRGLASATSYSNDGGVISIGSLVELTINDSSADHTGKITGGHGSGNYAAVYVGANATFTLNGGSITGNVGRYQGGVYVNGGTFIMNGGSITGNTGG
ncbi:MAG: right-handed parallel beta-helix repeat-containing protein, partial [Clostridia bacterium]|nr:right-handed parallel beta-helix repeat-containing protein [Clostridia bacterium]